MKVRTVRHLSVAVAVLLAPGVTVLGSLAAPAGAANVSDCVSSQLTLAHARSQGTAGTTYVPIVITNHRSTCAIWGVPAIQPVSGAAHRALGPLARNLSMGEMAMRQVIAKGASVSVAFGIVDTGNYPSATCAARRASGVKVSLGNFFANRFVGFPLTVCTKIASTTTRLLAKGSQG
ncbi:MAG TPA: DUF4232 domain-containing protein [Acidimicrobiales bacterium]|nr:DUF4232 domain-containing protein [Acidimicrobiales bacterium]